MGICTNYYTLSRKCGSELDIFALTLSKTILCDEESLNYIISFNYCGMP